MLVYQRVLSPMTFPIHRSAISSKNSVSFSDVRDTAEANQGADDGQHVALSARSPGCVAQRVFFTWYFFRK